MHGQGNFLLINFIPVSIKIIEKLQVESGRRIFQWELNAICINLHHARLSLEKVD